MPAPFTLPAPNTDEGATARLLINEANGPNGDAALTVQAMGWMKRVLVNRLAHPQPFGATGATTLIEIIAAHRLGVQFAGFAAYPTIAAGVQKNIQDKLDIAADSGHRLQPMYLAFVQAAITAATAPAPIDPCPTGLYFWRRENSGGPGGRATLFRSLDGNSFFTLPADFFGGGARPRTRRH